MGTTLAINLYGFQTFQINFTDLNRLLNQKRVTDVNKSFRFGAGEDRTYTPN